MLGNVTAISDTIKKKTQQEPDLVVDGHVDEVVDKVAVGVEGQAVNQEQAGNNNRKRQLFKY